MIIHERQTGEHFRFTLELELFPPFSIPGPGWEFEKGDDGRLSARHLETGEIRHADPKAKWCVHVPELIETDEAPFRDLARRQTGNWNLIEPGDFSRYLFIPETHDELDTLKKYGFIPEV